MAFIQLCGVAVSAVMNSAEREDKELGEGVQRAFDGSIQRSNRGFKREWKGTTVLDTPANSQALLKLMQGRVRHWTFDADLYSDLGLGPTASTLATSVAGGQYGNALQLGATTGAITYAGLGGASGVDGFTLLILRKNGAAWEDFHLSWTSAGALSAVYKDGVAQATSLPSWITSYTHSTGTLILNNTTGSAQLYDEMVTFAFEAPLSVWSSQLDTFRNTNAWPQTPGLTLAGTVGSGTVECTVGSSKLQHAVLSGGEIDNAESFTFSMLEA